MTRTQKDLIVACRTKGISSWVAVKAYADRYKKYDNLTLRQLDAVVVNLK
jgi:hypothetical protein